MKKEIITTNKITQDTVFKFFRSVIKQFESELIQNGELNCTRLAEMAQDFFGVATYDTHLEIEQMIFDWAVDYENIFIKNKKGKNEK